MARILLVEDHDGVARGVMRQLTSRGHELAWEKSVNDGLRRLSKDRFDLEIWDGSLAEAHDGFHAAVARHKEGHPILIHSGEKAVVEAAEHHQVPVSPKANPEFGELVESMLRKT